MTLSQQESDAALNFYVAFGNLHRDPDSPTLLKQYQTAKVNLIHSFFAPNYVLGPQDMVDLRHLLGIVVWIRSEQLATKEVVRKLNANDTQHLPPPVEINTHALSIANCGGDLEHALEWWKRLAVILEQHQFKGAHSWMVNDFGEKKL